MYIPDQIRLFMEILQELLTMNETARIHLTFRNSTYVLFNEFNASSRAVFCRNTFEITIRSMSRNIPLSVILFIFE